MADDTTMTLEDKLKAIEEAVLRAAGDPAKERQYLEAISDPMDSLQCEACQ